MLISPWTRGGYVYSEVNDHTSTIKLLERKFGIYCENISPWRRAVTGDLTHALNFDNPDYSWPDLPDTSSNWDKSKSQCQYNPPPQIPKQQSFPIQEEGTKKSQALPYEFKTNIEFYNNFVKYTIENSGENGAAFMIFNKLIPSLKPRKYTIESNKSITD